MERTFEELLLHCQNLEIALKSAEEDAEYEREQKRWYKQGYDERRWNCKEVRISSNLNTIETWARHDADIGNLRWLKGFCPCCKKPIDLTIWDEEHHYHHYAANTQWCQPRIARAYCAVLWGSNPGYAFGAYVLGSSLRELSTPPEVDPEAAELVLLHTDDVPANYLEILSEFWTLRLVSYIDGVPALYTSRGSEIGFDGVFTKLNAWNLEEYDKVVLLDIDTIPFDSPDELFGLETPAALIRGHHEQPHGSEVDASYFFGSESDEPYGWAQTNGGINAGVIVLTPSAEKFEQMKREVTCEIHPEHIPGNGPEQDYLSRFFSSHPWRSINVAWNFQLHHVPFALERAIEWRKSSQVTDRVFLPPRLKIPVQEIRLVHFSGKVKLWDSFLDMDLSVECRDNVEAFADHLLRNSCEGYRRWFERTHPEDHYESFNCALGAKKRVYLFREQEPVKQADGLVAENGTSDLEDITELVELGVNQVRGAAQSAVREWRRRADELITRRPKLLHEFRNPTVPPGSFPIGARVELLWPPASANTSTREEGQWHLAQVTAVHSDGTCVVKVEKAWSSGDTERRVCLDRIRPYQPLTFSRQVFSLMRLSISKSVRAWRRFDYDNIWMKMASLHMAQIVESLHMTQ